jgi:hypothetical protein
MIEIDPRHLLSKLAFGPTAANVEEVTRTGADRWFEEQLRPTGQDGCSDRIDKARWRLKYRVPNSAFDGAAPEKAPQFLEMDEDRAIAVVNWPIEQHWQVVQKNLPGPERSFFRQAVSVTTLLRAVHSRCQLREIVVDFWPNHFNVHDAGEALVAVSLPSYDRDVIRAHALGNFRVLLEAVASSAAMQIYLNNRSSRGGAANENYARELFELHTLGRPAYLNALYSRWRDVPGAPQGKPQGYIDQDVYEAARAFTGWTIEDGAGLGAGRKLAISGKPTYVRFGTTTIKSGFSRPSSTPISPPWRMAARSSIWLPNILPPRAMSAASYASGSFPTTRRRSWSRRQPKFGPSISAGPIRSPRRWQQSFARRSSGA